MNAQAKGWLGWLVRKDLPILPVKGPTDRGRKYRTVRESPKGYWKEKAQDLSTKTNFGKD